ncbi:MAG: hypothetical protein D6757_10590 [Alphaproteobacteria bacterium]|nr:MAG: hypothetical protein D6757_10590 [Alphaproteobacteria bacterium]
MMNKDTDPATDGAEATRTEPHEVIYPPLPDEDESDDKKNKKKKKNEGNDGNGDVRHPPP